MMLRADVHPSGGITNRPVRPGETLQIRWDAHDARTSVDLVLWNADDATITEIAHGIDASLRAYTWAIPGTLPRGDHYRIGLRPDGSTRRTLFSSGYFTVEGMLRKSPDAKDRSIPSTSGLTLGPNPALISTHIQWADERETLVVRSITGEEVVTRPLASTSRSYDLDVRPLHDGVYTVELIGPNGDKLRTLLSVQ